MNPIKNIPVFLLLGLLLSCDEQPEKVSKYDTGFEDKLIRDYDVVLSNPPSQQEIKKLAQVDSILEKYGLEKGKVTDEGLKMIMETPIEEIAETFESVYHSRNINQLTQPIELKMIEELKKSESEEERDSILHMYNQKKDEIVNEYLNSIQ